jgi:hypothetical protein
VPCLRSPVAVGIGRVLELLVVGLIKPQRNSAVKLGLWCMGDVGRPLCSQSGTPGVSSGSAKRMRCRRKYRDYERRRFAGLFWSERTPFSCGCLVPTPRHDQVLVCNECDQVVKNGCCFRSRAHSIRILMSQPLCSARCPHCGVLNTFPGFSAIEAFTCSGCGEGVVMNRALQ